MKGIAVLEWYAWEKFLLTSVLGDAGVRVRTDPFTPFPAARFEELCHCVSAVCFQINLSVPRWLPIGLAKLGRRFARRGVHVVNGRVRDIRKPALHEHLRSIGLRCAAASPDGPADEMLFVKTSLNYGGETEKWMPPEVLAATGLDRLLAEGVDADTYRAVRRGDLPADSWSDPALVVEKYVSNPEYSFFRVYFCGKQVIIVKAHDESIIKKMSGDDRDTNYLSDLDLLRDGSDKHPISARLKRDIAIFLDRTEVDFGCVDIVHDGQDRYYIVDLNPTPSAPDGSPDDELNSFLRQGITNPARRKAPLASG